MFNHALRYVRAYNGLKQCEVAASLGQSNNYISVIEAGKQIPSLLILQKYAAFLEVELSSLIAFAEAVQHKDFIVDRMMCKKMQKILAWVKDTQYKNV